MNGKKYFWLKLKDDFFREKKIKKLRQIAGGDTFTIIYLKMQLLSLKNNGSILYEGVEGTFAEEIALEIDEEVKNVEMTIIFLMNNGLLEEMPDYNYVLPETLKCIGRESESAERVRKHRLKKESLLLGNDIVTKCNTEKEIEKEIEIELDKDIYISEAATSASVPYKQIMQHFNSICQKASKIRGIEGTRKKAVAARWKANNDIELFITLFKKTEESKFLNGENDRNWQVDFDWLMKPQNMTKVLEGRYDNNTQSYKPRGKQEIVPEWMQDGYKQPETTLGSKTTTDIENELERLLKGEK